MIQIRTSRELEIQREAGRITAQCMELVAGMIKPGVTTQELDQAAERFIRAKGAVPTFLHYDGYPASICASVNEQVVHGVPGKYRLQEGDIVGIDLGATYGGYVGDMARTFGVGHISQADKDLIRVTQECFQMGLAQMVEGNRIGDVSYAVQRHAEAHGYGVIRDLCGHGCGQKMHEDPEVPNFGRPGHGVRLKAGMVLAVEPMINLGTWRVEFMEDGSVLTEDRKNSAHYENTVAITQNGPVILTAL